MEIMGPDFPNQPPALVLMPIDNGNGDNLASA